MENKKRGQAGLVSALILIISSLVVVSAVVTNSTNDSFTNFNESLNITPINIANETLNITLQNQTLVNLTLTNETNSTTPIENITMQNQITNETLNLTVPAGNLTSTNVSLPKKLKNLSEIAEKNKNKLNNETEAYFKNIKDKKEVRKYILKFRNSIDEN